MHYQTAGHDAQFQAFVQGVNFELAMQLLKKIVDGEVAQFRLHHARLELVDVEKLVQQARHRNDRVIEPLNQLRSSRL